ncbi:MAG TPA: hypothetical protein VGP81_03345 [Pyrinomonadaceae bacterium]|jgi:hypothetical protein|nr:hypothetical protein [Pyrinomonadaceae bacterium]
MKRCPECDFLYYDEQECCDMDGTVLRFTSFLPSLAPPQPTERNDLKSIWGRLAIPLLTLVVIGSVLVTLYRAAPPKFSSVSAPKNQPAGTNQDMKLPASDSPQMVTTPAIPAESAEPSSVPATRAQNTAAKSTGRDPFSNEERLTIEPATRVQMEPRSPVINAPKPPPGQTSPPAASQKTAATANTASVHPQPPPAKPSPQSKTQNQDKDSKVKSLFKKAGRVLKKPF